MQLALNEPDYSDVNVAARSLVDWNGGCYLDYVDWKTKPASVSQCLATIQGSTVAHCTAISEDGQLLAVGGEDCRVHVYSIATCEVGL